MAWVITFIFSWILFLFLVDLKTLKFNIFAGILTLALASLVDWGGINLELYAFHNIIIPWAGCSAFYKFGPILTIGILYAQYLPTKRWLQTLNIVVISLAFLSVEWLIIQVGAADYIHWHTLASLLIDLLALTSLTWFTLTFLKKKENT